MTCPIALEAALLYDELFPAGSSHIIGERTTAKNAGIPIIMVGFDFKGKFVEFRDPFYPTDDYKKDMAFILEYFSGITGANPELGVTKDMI